MKTATAPLITLLGSETQVMMADLVTITLVGGGVVYLTSSDTDIVYGGHTFSSKSIQFVRDKTRIVRGVEVDSLGFTFYGDSTTLLNGQPILQAASLGSLDGATIRLDRAFMQVWGTVVGTLLQFLGNVSQVDVSRTEAKVQVKSNLELLNISMPKNLWQAGCINTLYDSACGLARTAVSGAVTSNSPASVINCNLSNAAGYFNLGYVTFSNGVNSGLTRTVKTYTTGAVTLMNPFPNAPAISDLFSAFHGCDKLQATCNGYGNLARFRGFPYVPSPDLLT